MNDVIVVLTVIGLFLVRIGIPLILLVALGTMIERYQSHQHAEMMKIHKLYEEMEQINLEDESEVQKVA